MPIQWRKPARSLSAPGFIKVPPNRVVALLNAPDELAILWLHWVAEKGDSYPCLGEASCPYCPARRFEYAYAAALAWTPGCGRWVPGIMPLGDPRSTLCQEDFKGQAIVVGKEKKVEKRSRTIYYGTNTDSAVPKPPSVPTFDIRPILLRRWGLFAEAELIGCEFHPPQPTLPFPEERTA